MLLWIILACLTAIVLLVLLRPLAGPGIDGGSADAFDSAVYRDQLGEIESDRARGLIGGEEAEAARVEIARRLLAADSKAAASAKISTDTSHARAATIAVAVALPLLALGLYLAYGSPRMPDQPLAARLQDAASDQNLEALFARDFTVIHVGASTIPGPFAPRRALLFAFRRRSAPLEPVTR